MLDLHRDSSSPAAAQPWPPKSGGARPLPHHLPALDGIRGIAILVVLIYHFANSLQVLGLSSPLLQMSAMGWCGVDIFFVLSGFLITGILIDTRSAPRYFQSFYARRALRIFPLYYCALAAVALLQWWIPDAGTWGARGSMTSPASLVWPAAFLENVAIAFGGRGPTGVTTHYWSLAVEEHFYLVWPLLVFLAKEPKKILGLAMLALVGAMAGRVLCLWREVDLNHVFALTPVRVDGLALGACAAVLVRQYDLAALRRPAVAVLAVSLTALTLLGLARGNVEQSDPAFWLVGFPLVSLASAAVVVLALQGGWTARLLSAAPLRWLGKYSFGLYVWHPIIGVLLLHSKVALTHPGSPPAQIMLAAAGVLALDFAAAWLSYEGMERRFLALRRYFRPFPAAPPAPQASLAAESARALARTAS